MLSKLTDVIAQSGMWNGQRAESHAFLLSPSVYTLTQAQEQELSSLGIALYDCLFGLSHIAVIAYDRGLNYRGPWFLARTVFSTGVPKIYQALQGMNPKHIPQLLKLDLMVDQSGAFKIAEIDGHNKHGVGYSTLGMRFREALYPDAKALPGTVSAIVEEMKRQGHTELKLFYSDQERFYIPEFEVAGQEFKKYGINCRIVSEITADSKFMQRGLFLDLPFLNKRNKLYQDIIPAYCSGNVQFIIPPKPFLGAKGVLALLRNDTEDERLESLLQSFIKKQSLELVRSYIPETLLVGKGMSHSDVIKNRLTQKRYVLKKSISSGMKGTIFSDSDAFAAAFAQASETKMDWILQEEVTNQPQLFSWFEKESGTGHELHTSHDWFMRVTVQYVRRKLADVIITARRDKSVHGAKDSLQLGTMIV